ncbi:MAG TPA: 30S ribosome-binding factor RbfA [Aggregatilineales bacterium]|nr:30S ribosome-binding factor RbfA [Aggregatilineales bacterium]
MPSKKQGRVAELIQEILSSLIQFEVKDPRLQGVTIMDVDVDRELMYATVYVSALGGEEEREEVLDGLDNASGFLRRELGANLSLRRVPELRFEWDETFEQAQRIEQLLDSIEIPPAEDEDVEPDDDDSE